ncbi:MAG TPA: mechanosensitive ion channel domain-containing protein [Gemmatimonadaceae bacterium]
MRTSLRIRRSRMLAVALLCALIAAGLLLPARLPALQLVPGAPADTAPSADEAVEAPDSPRAAMRAFLARGEAGDYARAASLLAIGGARGAEMARRVHRFIERRVTIDLDSISPLPEGDLADGEPLVDQVGRMYVALDSLVRPIELVRVRRDGERQWVISRATIAAADAAFASLDSSWVARRLPPTLLEEGPFGFPRWKWLGVLLGVPLVWLLTIALTSLVRLAALAVARRTRATWDEEVVLRLRGPVRLFVASVLAGLLPLLLDLDAATIEVIWRLLRIVAVAAVFWALFRMVGVAETHLARKAWRTERTNASTIVPLVGRTLRLAIGLVAVLVAISQFGYPVGTVLAGLGLGGLVVALAAQKTVENLFGSVSLAADRVFRVGDWVRIEDVQGTVERIGLRSTHVRTLDRTLVKIPNGRLAEMRVESFGERDRIRFFVTLALSRSTTAAQMRQLLRDVEAVLAAHERVWPDGIAVRFVGIGAQGLDVTATAWFLTTSVGEFEVIRQELLLTVLEIVERAGTSLAVPVQEVRVARDEAAIDTSAAGVQ